MRTARALARIGRALVVRIARALNNLTLAIGHYPGTITLDDLNVSNDE
jgi:hypothetical protein